MSLRSTINAIAHGNLSWQVYDRTSHKSDTFGSDRDVRAWIEERHYHI